MGRRHRSTSRRSTCFLGSDDKARRIEPTTDYQLTYLEYEAIHRHHRHWPLSDLKTMTPRQRKYWKKIGELRTRTIINDKKKIHENGGVPIAAD